ncbi:DUF58 domain-containing protein [Paenibacillus sp. JDR-2]|uniref:DUF58 domain-containing protein n=1 Tax=Paenibacillus sp. (strain JDR-2) TaxID=324057 RepID=UPI000166B00D|nr:DUF58 domain-containing protein [Paenibacillus sp. JDR-2]ACS99512.1 protein of unknown function DUF58 [Paenibacillus sp. JDR-2]
MKTQGNDSNVMMAEAAKGQPAQGFPQSTGNKTKPAGAGKTGTGAQEAVVEEPVQSARPSVYRTRWGAWLLISAGWLLSLAGMFTRGGAVETFMLIVLSLLPLLSIVMPLLSTFGLTVSRVIPEPKIKDGDEAVIRLTLKRSSFVPFVWIAVHDGMTNTSTAKKTRLDYRYLVAPLLRKKVEISYSVLAVRRGEHQFGQVTVTVGDWLGLTAFHKKLDCPGTLVAVPALPEQQRRRTEQLHGAVAEQVSGDSSAAFISDGGEISDITADRLLQQAGIGPGSRPYREGDSMRHINWRAAAKGRGMFTKQHLLEQPAEIIMIADTYSAAFNHDGRLFDVSLAWLARGIEHAAADGCDVRLLAGAAGTGAKEKHKRGGQAGQHANQLLERLAKLKLAKAAVSVDSLRTELGSLKPGGVIHVYTADWRSGQSWIQLAAYAADQQCRIRLHVVTKQSVLTFAMREQQRLLEEAGMSVNWLAYPDMMNRPTQTAEGGGQHARLHS